MTTDEVGRAIRRIAHEILERNPATDDLLLAGIVEGGVPLANRIASLIAEISGLEVPVGRLDVGHHRDDGDTRAAVTTRGTKLPSPDGRTVVLIDDVLFTGRTVRAALDALTDLGRPRAVQLAVLVDRGHRELPIRPDFIGKNLPTSRAVRVQVRIGPGQDDAVVVEPLPPTEVALG